MSHDTTPSSHKGCVQTFRIVRGYANTAIDRYGADPAIWRRPHILTQRGPALVDCRQTQRASGAEAAHAHLQMSGKAVQSCTVNPFSYQGPVEPHALIDRRLELDTLQRAAADRVAIRLAAPRRFGKTSLLDAHIASTRAVGHRAVRIDRSKSQTSGTWPHAWRKLQRAPNRSTEERSALGSAARRNGKARRRATLNPSECCAAGGR